MGDLIEVDFDALEGDDVIRLSNADYLARPLRLDSTEAAALVVGLRAMLDTTSTTEREVVARTLAKVEDAAGEAARVAHQVQLHPSRPAQDPAVADAVQQALAARHRLRLTHASVVRDEMTTRDVDPVALSTAGGHTYLDAWCHRAQDQRLFRLDRVVAAEVLDEPVTEGARGRPRDLSDGLFRPAPEARAAMLRLTPRRPLGRGVLPGRDRRGGGRRHAAGDPAVRRPALAGATGATAGRSGDRPGAVRAGPAGHRDRTEGAQQLPMSGAYDEEDGRPVRHDRPGPPGLNGGGVPWALGPTRDHPRHPRHRAAVRRQEAPRARARQRPRPAHLQGRDQGSARRRRRGRRSSRPRSRVRSTPSGPRRSATSSPLDRTRRARRTRRASPGLPPVPSGASCPEPR